MSWGGERQAAIEFDKQLGSAEASPDEGREHLTRFTGGAGLTRRVNPYFDVPDTRGRLWARAERELVKNLRAGVTGAWQHVAFGDDSRAAPPVQGRLVDHLVRGGADLTLDTRLDPMLARNAVYARAAVEHVAFRAGPAANLTTFDVRGYFGLLGQTILVGRVLREGTDAALPPYMKLPFGGIGTVRGFRAGSSIGDNVAAASLELLVPLTSPLNVARFGISGFVDAGAAYDYGKTLTEQRIERGIGASVWATAAFLRFSVAVAHGIGGSTRVHVGGAVSF